MTSAHLTDDAHREACTAHNRGVHGRDTRGRGCPLTVDVTYPSGVRFGYRVKAPHARTGEIR